MFLTIVVFILILGILVFVHELGHFLLAKRAGVKVEEFGLGFPPRIFGKKIKGTVYSINAVPLGGFVKIYGENGAGRKDPASFSSKTVWQRFKILVAGVAMNLAIAILFLSIGHLIGLPAIIDDPASFIGPIEVKTVEVAPGSPAELAGLQIGDTIKNFSISVESQVEPERFSINEVTDLQELSEQYKGSEVILTIQRGKNEMEIGLLDRAEHPEGEGPLGIAVVNVGVISQPWHRALVKGLEDFVNILVLILIVFFEIIKFLLTQGKMMGEFYGPVGIFGLTGQVAQMGVAYILQFAALLSINFAIINVFPFPGLDGGRILFLVIEKIKGSPVNQRAERLVHAVGFALLILLIIAITFKDILRLF